MTNLKEILVGVILILIAIATYAFYYWCLSGIDNPSWKAGASAVAAIMIWGKYTC